MGTWNETSPLYFVLYSTMSEAAVLQALQCACSQDPAVLKVGEQQLKAWETEKGFYTSLAVSMNAREIMSVHLKQ